MERTPKKGWPVFMGLWSKDRVNPIHRREFQKSRFHQHIFAEIMSGGRGRGRGRGSGLSFNTEVNILSGRATQSTIILVTVTFQNLQLGTGNWERGGNACDTT